MLTERRLRRLLVAVGFLVSALFAWLAVRDVDFERFRAGLTEASWIWLVPALGTIAAGVLVRAARWRLLFMPETRPPFGPTARALVVGYFFNNVLPGRTGEALRVVSLHEEAGTSRVEALATAFSERVYDVLTLLVLLFVAVPWLPTLTWIRTAALLGAALVLGLLVLVAVLLRFGERAIVVALLPLTRLRAVSESSIRSAASNVFLGLAGFQRARVAIPAFGLSFVSILAFAVGFWLVLVAMHVHAGFAAALLVMVTTNLAMVLPSSPAALGVFEAAVLAALTPFGIDSSHALAYAVVLHVLNVVPLVGLGAILVGRQGSRFLQRPRAPDEATPAGPPATIDRPRPTAPRP